MVFFRLVEIVVGVLILVLFWTQIIRPAMAGTLFFPYFRRQGELGKEELKLNQRDVEETLEVKVEQRKQKRSKEEGNWQ